MVEAVRIGYVAARDPKAMRQWQRHVERGRPSGRGLTGQALEQAVMALALQHPDLVHYEKA